MARIDALKRKLAARQGKAEFRDNCNALRAEIARLEAAANGGEQEEAMKAAIRAGDQL